ncbi:hypothetical protein M0811_10530 [Anaeramoeba ignava]|uniref:BTB domain-containing protein n=1 Tax=Anaeramoeba ignava TaxID=1746090 RepID=A0A9Q0LGX8_ANAIG|nr:hypothetical protein M0811_10530 [Anaeramoeba ignava]
MDNSSNKTKLKKNPKSLKMQIQDMFQNQNKNLLQIRNQIQNQIQIQIEDLFEKQNQMFFQNQIQIQNQNQNQNQNFNLNQIQKIYFDKKPRKIEISKLYQFPLQELNKFLIYELLSNYKTMFQNEENCDFIIYAGEINQKIPCHKNILNSRSRFFYEKNHEKADMDELYLPKFEYDVVEPIISFFYGSEFKFNSNNFEKYFEVAKFFKLSSLRIKIEKEVSQKINAKNAIVIYLKSILIESNYLSSICEKFIKENIDQIILNDEIGEINNKELRNIIEFIQSTPKENKIDLIWKLSRDWKEKFKKTNKNLINKEEYIDPIQIQQIPEDINDFYYIVDSIKNAQLITSNSKTENNPFLPSTDQLRLMFQKNQKLQEENQKIKEENEKLKEENEKIKEENQKIKEENEKIQKTQTEQTEIIKQKNQEINQLMESIQEKDQEINQIKRPIQQKEKNKIKQIQSELDSNVTEKAKQTFLKFTTRISELKKDSIKEIIDTMEEFSFSQDIQEFGCYLLQMISAENERNPVEIQKLKGLQTLIKTMNNFPNNQLVQYHGCGAVGNICADFKNKNIIRKLNGIQPVIDAINNFPNDSDVQYHACGALWNFANNEPNRIEIRKLNGIQPIINAMNRFPDNEGIQLHGCGGLKNLAANEENRIEIPKLNGIEAIINAVNKFPNNPQIQMQGSSALWNLASQNKENQKRIIKLNGISLLKQSMNIFPNIQNFLKK